MAIIGTGIDIIRNARMELILKKQYSKRLIYKMLHPD